MENLFVVLLIFVIASTSFCAAQRPIFNVVSYGATGNGQTDDTQAFLKAWKDVCSATQQTAELLIPKNKIFMLQPLSLEGPCNSATIKILLEGTVIAPRSIRAWKFLNDKTKWIGFSDIRGLVIAGGGRIDGQGAAWWNYGDVSDRPTALHFHNCQDVTLTSILHRNSPKNHISINTCNGFEVSNVKIIAPMQSPNTDGIDISDSSNIFIHSSTIQTGDDCIAINSGTSLVNISDIFCGPGHGISVGSLGHNGEEARVEKIHVRNCTFVGTSNGVRVKTWRGGRGYAREIRFEDIKVVGVQHPVIINQNYYDLGSESVSGSAVKISDVTYERVKGTSSSESAVELICDRSVGCSNIVMDHISISRKDGGKAEVSCIAAQGTCSNCNPIVPCLSKRLLI